MSELIKHECGIAVVRLLKPLEYFEQKYGTPLYGFNQLFLLMEKQHNRGQDGAGIGCVKLNVEAGLPYMFRKREWRRNPLDRIFADLLKGYDKQVKSGRIIPELPQTVKENFDFGGEVLMGHLRYGTSGSYGKESLHPYIRRSNWPTRNLMLAGNFNMTNLAALNNRLIARGQHPIFGTDTQTVLEEIGFYLDEEHDSIYKQMRDTTPGEEIPKIISDKLDPVQIVKQASQNWDGGYTIGGLIGNGDAFVMRDPMGIRPCSYIQNDELIAFASERVALMTIFGVDKEEVNELEPGHVFVMKKDGKYYSEPFTEPQPRKSCSFERIYFSRGNDPDIYEERKALGAAMTDQVLKAIDYDLGHSVFSYIPNTAEIAYYGFMHGMRVYRREQVKRSILDAASTGDLSSELLDQLIMSNWPRAEKVAHKDIKLRTFISQEKSRTQMASHVYDISYGSVNPGDYLVCIDDSIVRGTTLRQSILRILSRTKPRKIIIASTAPQIRYPDCYGIDMSELGKFIAFQAACELLKESGNGEVLREVYEDCVRQVKLPASEMTNHVKRIYKPFTPERIAEKVAQIVYPKDAGWEGEVEVIFQSIENLHKAIPEHTGDWYFTGNYPTPGGYAVLNQAYINFYEKRQGRSY